RSPSCACSRDRPPTRTHATRLNGSPRARARRLASWWTNCERGCRSRRPPSRVARAVLAAVVLAPLPGTGCGGTRHQTSHAQFSARAAAICAAEGRKLGYIRSHARGRCLAHLAPMPVMPPSEAPTRLRVLGSTGSIGTQALDVCGRSGEFELVGLSAERSWEVLVEQARTHGVQRIALADEHMAAR